MRDPSRTPGRDPYRAPGTRRRTTRWEGRAILLWGLLTAPYLIFALAFVAGLVLYEVGRPISDAQRDLLAGAMGGLASASVRTLFLYPTAFLLQSLTARRHLSLEIMIVGLYLLEIADVLTYVDAVPESHAFVQAVHLSASTFTLLTVPLFIAWCVRALRRWGRSR